MTEPDHQQILGGFHGVIGTHEWDRLSEYVNEDAVFEYPQSGERFRGLASIRAQFESYPGLEPGTSALDEVIGGAKYALTPRFTLVAIDGSGDRGATVFRARYPDGSDGGA